MTTIALCINSFFTSVVVKYTMFEQIDKAVTVCQQFSEVFSTMTISDLSYCKYHEYKLYTENCLNLVNDRIEDMMKKIKFALSEQFKRPEYEAGTLSAIQKDFDNIMNNEQRMKLNKEKKSIKIGNQSQLQNIFINNGIEFDKPNLDQDNNAAPIANNDNYNDYDLPSLEDLLNVQKQKREENLGFISNKGINSNNDTEAPQVSGFKCYYNINEADGYP